MTSRPSPTTGRRVAALLLSMLALLATAAVASARTDRGHAPQHHPALGVTSITPGGDAVRGSAPITVRFSAPVSSARRPAISPALPGHWTQTGPRTLVFTPTGAQLPLTPVTVTVPAGTRDTAGATLRRAVTHTFTVAQGSTTRLTQLLSQLDYLPEHYRAVGGQPSTHRAAAQQRALFAAPRGRLVLGSGWPSALQGLMHSDTATVLRGAVMAFQSQHGLAMSGTAGRDTWAALLNARLHGSMNRAGYTYALASEGSPESLTIYHDGHVVAHSAANTGIAASPTQTGTFPVYERLRAQIMRGTDPDGATYADPVQYVAYFNGGDAVHYIARGSYGFPQSLGCVELPLSAAAQIWPYLTYGTLVTVAP